MASTTNYETIKCRIETFWNADSECPPNMECHECYFYLNNEDFKIKKKQQGK